MTKNAFIGFRLTPELKASLEQIANNEGRSVSQVCELFVKAGIETYRKEGPKYLQRVAARPKLFLRVSEKGRT